MKCIRYYCKRFQRINVCGSQGIIVFFLDKVKKQVIKIYKKIFLIILFNYVYGHESRVSTKRYVPYSWQFADESVCGLAGRGYPLNCFGLISRRNQCHWTTITARFVAEQLEILLISLLKKTVVVLDCSGLIQVSCYKAGYLTGLARGGVFVLYLRPCSPHMNLAESLWRNLKV